MPQRPQVLDLILADFLSSSNCHHAVSIIIDSVLPLLRELGYPK